MSYNGAGLFSINTVGNPVVTATVISSTWLNALTADLATGLSTCILKDGTQATTARIPFALGINSTLATNATSTLTGSILTAGGVGIVKDLWVGGLANVAGAITAQSTLAVTGAATFSSTVQATTFLASSGILYFNGTTSSNLRLASLGGTQLNCQLADGSDYAGLLAEEIHSSVGKYYFTAGSSSGESLLKSSGTTILARTANDGGYATFDAAAYKVAGVAGVSFSGAVATLTVVNGIITAHT